MGSSVIFAAKRTPMGAMGGVFAEVSAITLGTVVGKAILDQMGIDPARVDEVIMGNVLPAGLGQNPARQVALGSGLPVSAGATTINKVCGSGMKAVMLADQAIRLGEARVVLAGGIENMTRAPYLLPKARGGYRMGHGEIIDSMIHDGLWDIYGSQSMGNFGDQCAAKFGFSKSAQDDFAVRSFERARQAIDKGWFTREIAPIPVIGRKETITIAQDESPAKFDEAKLRSLKPAFSKEGTITAGNASSINDGAAALLIAEEEEAARLGCRPIARIVGSSTHSQEPEWFTTAPIGSIRKLLDRVSWTVDSTDLFEVNEAFATVAMAAAHDLKIPEDKLNIHGGAVALGHPIGASGARILVTLLHALERTGGKRGVASLCIGGGEAVALAVEMLS